MEYDILNRTGPCQRRYLSPRIPQNHQVVFLPTTYQSVPQPKYQSVGYSQYQNFQQPSPRRLPALPRVRAQNAQQAIIQTQNRHAQNIYSRNAFDIAEPPSPTFPSRNPPSQVPIYPSIEEVLFNDGWNEMAGQQTENSGIDIPPILETCEESSFDAAMATVPTASPPATVCCSCGQQWMRLVPAEFAFLANHRRTIEKITATQKQTNKALSLFSNDVILDMEDNKQWRAAIEQQISGLLTMYGSDNEVNDI